MENLVRVPKMIGHFSHSPDPPQRTRCVPESLTSAFQHSGENVTAARRGREKLYSAIAGIPRSCYQRALDETPARSTGLVILQACFATKPALRIDSPVIRFLDDSLKSVERQKGHSLPPKFRLYEDEEQIPGDRKRTGNAFLSCHRFLQFCENSSQGIADVNSSVFSRIEFVVSNFADSYSCPSLRSGPFMARVCNI